MRPDVAVKVQRGIEGVMPLDFCRGVIDKGSISGG
jgi:hypothetical protein